jgi:hypothetical protein
MIQELVKLFTDQKRINTTSNCIDYRYFENVSQSASEIIHGEFHILLYDMKNSGMFIFDDYITKYKNIINYMLDIINNTTQFGVPTNLLDKDISLFIKNVCNIKENKDIKKYVHMIEYIYSTPQNFYKIYYNVIFPIIVFSSHANISYELAHKMRNSPNDPKAIVYSTMIERALNLINQSINKLNLRYIMEIYPENDFCDYYIGQNQILFRTIWLGNNNEELIQNKFTSWSRTVNGALGVAMLYKNIVKNANKLILYITKYDTKIFTPIQLMASGANNQETEVVLTPSHELKPVYSILYNNNSTTEKMENIISKLWNINLKNNMEWEILDGKIKTSLKNKFFKNITIEIKIVHVSSTKILTGRRRQRNK